LAKRRSIGKSFLIVALGGPLLMFIFIGISELFSSTNDNQPKEVDKSEHVNEELSSDSDNNESSSSSGSAYCSIHGEYFPSKYTNEYGEVKTTGCTECLYNDVNEELSKPGGFRDRVSNF